MTERMKTMDRKKLGIVLISCSAALLMVTLLLAGFLRKDREEPQENRMAEMMADVPDAEDKVLPETKSEAYENMETRSNTSDYWEKCEELYEEEKEDEEMTGMKTADELFGSPAPQVAPEPEQDYSNPYRETPEEREERHRRSREDAIRMAQEMSEVQEEEPEEEVLPEAVTSERISTGKTVVKRSSIISSLEDGWDTDGITSLDADDNYFDEDERHPFRCMFAKDSKIKNGQRVSVILQEDIVVSGTLVPRHTHIMATCKIADRLELELTNIEIGGRILFLGYEAYDVDGNKGIYCPDVGTTGQQARSSGRNIISSRLSGMMGGLARDVVSTGVSLIQSKDGEMTVTVPAGYTFFIVKKNLNR